MKLVRIAPYDPAWPQRYEEEAPKIVEALEELVAAIEHVGSTSVVGLEAKPTIDILVGANGLSIGDEAMARMADLGYEFRGEMGVPGRRYFRKGDSFPRDFNVHVVEFEGRLWSNNLAFRDYLRAHPKAAAEYSRLKHDLVSREGGRELGRYAAGKASFIADIVKRATEQREEPNE